LRENCEYLGAGYGGEKRDFFALRDSPNGRKKGGPDASDLLFTQDTLWGRGDQRNIHIIKRQT